MNNSIFPKCYGQIFDSNDDTCWTCIVGFLCKIITKERQTEGRDD